MIFRKKVKELKAGDIAPKGISKTIPRPTEEDIEKIAKNVENLRKTRPTAPKVDNLFLQEISDRLYGPDSESYIEALKRLNKGFRPRPGKNGVEFYEPEIVTQTKEKEREINQNISKETR
jgi:hypothetical protein